MAKKAYVVAHPKLYLAVKGKLTQMEVGTEVSMEEKHAKKLLDSGKLALKGAVKKAVVGGKTEKPSVEPDVTDGDADNDNDNDEKKEG